MNETEIINNIISVYEKYDYPFVVGYSGGKDSTLTLDLVLTAINEIYKRGKPLKKTYIVSSNTQIENPYVTTLINTTEQNIKSKLEHLKLDFLNVKPLPSETFWVSIIGKGYPLPTNRFRWCTRQLKINPMNLAMKDIYLKHDKIISILGIREDESLSRKTRMDNNKNNEYSEFYKNSDNYRSFIFAPISKLETSELWRMAFKRRETIWGSDYGDLYEMYWETSKECPMSLEMSLLDNEQKHCGNSRWGCWMCPLSNRIWLNNLVDNGLYELNDLSEFRHWMINTRDLRVNRYIGGHQIVKGKKGISKIILKRKGYIKFKKIEFDDYSIHTRPKKNKRKKIVIKMKNQVIVESNINDFTIYSKKDYETLSNNIETQYNENGIDEGIVIYDNGELYLPATGPYTLKYRIQILDNLIDLKYKAKNKQIPYLDEIDVLSSVEIEQIYYYWRKIARKLNKEKYIENEIYRINLKINKGETHVEKEVKRLDEFTRDNI